MGSLGKNYLHSQAQLPFFYYLGQAQLPFFYYLGQAQLPFCSDGAP